MFIPAFLIILTLLLFCYVGYSYRQKIICLQQAVFNLRSSQKYILLRMVKTGEILSQFGKTKKDKERCAQTIAREIMQFLYGRSDYVEDYAAVCEIVPSFFPSSELDNQKDSVGCYPTKAVQVELSKHLYLIWNS